MLERFPIGMLVYAGVGVPLVSIIAFRTIRDLAKRFCLCLSAVGFRRVYGVGGVAAAISVTISLNSGVQISADPSWAWAVIDRLFNDTLDTIILTVLAAPVVAAFISELAFWLILRVGSQQAVPTVVPARIEASEAEGDVERPTLEVSDFPSPFPSSNREQRKESKLRQLIPIEFHTGGLKQVVHSFLTETFRSSFFGYAPYSALLASNTSRSPVDGRRITILATHGDAVDFEWLHFSAFQVKRITDSCWILVRAPLEPGEAARIEEERMNAGGGSRIQEAQPF